MKNAALSILIVAFSATSALAQNVIVEAVQIIDGNAAIISHDLQLLGLASSDQYNPQSICNPEGNYGSRYSSNSVLNSSSNYGNSDSDLSAYNPIAKHPPVIVIGHTLLPLTKNPNFQNRIDPDVFISILCGSK